MNQRGKQRLKYHGRRCAVSLSKFVRGTWIDPTTVCAAAGDESGERQGVRDKRGEREMRSAYFDSERAPLFHAHHYDAYGGLDSSGLLLDVHRRRADV